MQSACFHGVLVQFSKRWKIKGSLKANLSRFNKQDLLPELILKATLAITDHINLHQALDFAVF